VQVPGGRGRGRRYRPPTTTIDLDSATLVRPLCKPLLQPSGDRPSLQFLGDFAIAQDPTGVYLERCGSRLNAALANSPYAGTIVAGAHAAAFCATAAISGYFLPSLRRFTLAPSNRGSICGWLSDCHLYFVYVLQNLYGATFPASPRG
jgi:hypothetical protein